MPTPSELQTERPRRSIFGNFEPPVAKALGGEPASTEVSARTMGEAPGTLQDGIDGAMARSFLYRFLAKGFELPDPENWAWLTSPATLEAVRSTVPAFAPKVSPSFFACASDLLRQFIPSASDVFAQSYVVCFGHTVRGDCPMNEIEYGDIKADPLFQPHRLADLGAFYAAFGLEMALDAAERQDHIAIELEFMSVLAAKEAYVLEHQFDTDQIGLVRDAQRKFLREHLARWTPAFTRRLGRMAGKGPLEVLARFTLECILLDCVRSGVAPGSEDLLLRPADEAGEKLCASCGIQSLPPGALPAV